MDEIFCATGVTARCGAGNAVLKVFVEQLHADALQCLADRSHLREDVDAVRVLFDHPAEASNLALDAPKARQQLLLVFDVSGTCRIHVDNDTP